MFARLRNFYDRLFGEPTPVEPTLSYELIRRPSKTLLRIMIEYNATNKSILTINEPTDLNEIHKCWEKLYKGTSETFIRVSNTTEELCIDVRSELTIFTLVGPSNYNGLVMYVPTAVALPMLKSLHEELKK